VYLLLITMYLQVKVEYWIASFRGRDIIVSPYIRTFRSASMFGLRSPSTPPYTHAHARACVSAASDVAKLAAVSEAADWNPCQRLLQLRPLFVDVVPGGTDPILLHAAHSHAPSLHRRVSNEHDSAAPTNAANPDPVPDCASRNWQHTSTAEVAMRWSTATVSAAARRLWQRHV